jgi:hypothetical protein
MGSHSVAFARAHGQGSAKSHIHVKLTKHLYNKALAHVAIARAILTAIQQGAAHLTQVPNVSLEISIRSQHGASTSQLDKFDGEEYALSKTSRSLCSCAGLVDKDGVQKRFCAVDACFERRRGLPV